MVHTTLPLANDDDGDDYHQYLQSPLPSLQRSWSALLLFFFQFCFYFMFLHIAHGAIAHSNGTRLPSALLRPLLSLSYRHTSASSPVFYTTAPTRQRSFCFLCYCCSFFELAAAQQIVRKRSPVPRWKKKKTPKRVSSFTIPLSLSLNIHSIFASIFPNSL